MTARQDGEGDYWLAGFFDGWHGRPSKPPKQPALARAYAKGYAEGQESQKDLTHD